MPIKIIIQADESQNVWYLFREWAVGDDHETATEGGLIEYETQAAAESAANAGWPGVPVEFA